jgi:hypothetical protein
MRAALIIAAACLAAPPAWAGLFVDVGGNFTRIVSKIALQPAKITAHESGAHLGVGARRKIGAHVDIGVRAEWDEMGPNSFFAVRAFDYRHSFSKRLAATAFLGAARLGLGTPAYGYYLGGGVQLKNLFPQWDLNVDLRYGDRLARDNLLPNDPKGGSPDNFHAVYGVSVYLSRRF